MTKKKIIIIVLVIWFTIIAILWGMKISKEQTYKKNQDLVEKIHAESKQKEEMEIERIQEEEERIMEQEFMNELGISNTASLNDESNNSIEVPAKEIDELDAKKVEKKDISET